VEWSDLDLSMQFDKEWQWKALKRGILEWNDLDLSMQFDREWQLKALQKGISIS